MVWHQWKKDTNYYMRLTLIHRIDKHVRKTFTPNVPVVFNPPVIFTYQGGKRTLINLEYHVYWNEHFKRQFSLVRCQLDDGTYIPLAKLRNKHLLAIQKFISK